jgi:acyl carrier protein
MYWVRHTRSAVKFESGLRALAANNVGAFLEIGPGAGLLTIGKTCLPDSAIEWLSSLHSKRAGKAQYIESAAKLWELGLGSDWKALHQALPQTKAVLPFYPFQRRCYWLPNAVLKPAAAGYVAEGTAPDATAGAKPVSEAAAFNAVKSVPEVVISVISAVGGMPVAEIKPEHHFMEDLGYDSMMIMELKSKLEIALASQNKIPIKDIMTVTTVNQLIQFAQERMVSPA